MTRALALLGTFTLIAAGFGVVVVARAARRICIDVGWTCKDL